MVGELGEQRPGLPVVPVGAYIYDVTADGNRFFPRQEAPQGLNLVAPYISVNRNHTEAEWAAILAFLDNCSAVGMRVHYQINSVAVAPASPAKWAAIADEIDRVKDHPAVLAYYLADEPGGADIAPSVLEAVYNFVKARDPWHPCTMAFCCVAPELYSHAFDIGMIDPCVESKIRTLLPISLVGLVGSGFPLPSRYSSSAMRTACFWR